MLETDLHLLENSQMTTNTPGNRGKNKRKGGYRSHRINSTNKSLVEEFNYAPHNFP